jgi:hypothetical protein
MSRKGVRMKALVELCDVLAEDHTLSTEGVGLLWSQCPPIELFSERHSNLTARHVNGILASARYLSRTEQPENRHEFLNLIFEFISSVPNISRKDGWPVSFTPEAYDVYFVELLGYLSEVAKKWPAVASDMSNVFTDFILSITEERDEDNVEPLIWARHAAIRSLLVALAGNFPALDGPDAESLAKCLLQHWLSLPQPSVMELSGRSVSAQSSPLGFYSSSSNGNSRSMKDFRLAQGYMSDGAADSRMLSSADDSPQYEANTFFTPASTPSRGTPRREFDGIGNGSFLHMNGNGSRAVSGVHSETREASRQSRQLLNSLEAESVESLEWHEVGFRLFVQLLEKAELDEDSVAQLRSMATGQLGALLPLLKACHSPGISLQFSSFIVIFIVRVIFSTYEMNFEKHVKTPVIIEVDQVSQSDH